MALERDDSECDVTWCGVLVSRGEAVSAEYQPFVQLSSNRTGVRAAGLRSGFGFAVGTQLLVGGVEASNMSVLDGGGRFLRFDPPAYELVCMRNGVDVCKRGRGMKLELISPDRQVVSCPPACPGASVSDVVSADLLASVGVATDMGVLYDQGCEGYLSGAVCLLPGTGSVCAVKHLSGQCRSW